jgi:diacylglycerol O-acyltransferase / wax synthase
MPADRLSALDQSFLFVESPTAHMHVGWASVFEPPDGGGPGFEELRDHVARRIRRAPRYRQMIQPIPLGLNAPVWVDDEQFDVSRHVVPARSDQFGEIVSACMSEPLPHDRPLWQLCIAERLEDGRVGVVGKAHHCMVDGIAAVELASLLLDDEPDPPEPEHDRWSPQPAPARSDLMLSGLTDFVRDELNLAALPARIANSPRSALGLAGRVTRAGRALVSSARPARLAGRLNRPISSARQLGLLSRRFEDLQRVKAAFGVKLNDVLLAAAAGGVRRFQHDRGEAPIPLKTMVPVSVRDDGAADALGNRISFIFVDLPCDEPDTARRLRRIHAETRQRKGAGEPQGADDLLQSVSYAPTPVRGAVSRIVASPRTFNLTVSNIPGLTQTMYMRGCRLAEVYPVVPIADRHALSIGMTTLQGGAFFGLYADPLVLPDVDELARDIDAEIDELIELSNEGAGETDLPAVSHAG